MFVTAYDLHAVNMACSYALAGDKARALVASKKALAAGIHKGQAMADSDLLSIRTELATM